MPHSRSSHRRADGGVGTQYKPSPVCASGTVPLIKLLSVQANNLLFIPTSLSIVRQEKFSRTCIPAPIAEIAQCAKLSLTSSAYFSPTCVLPHPPLGGHPPRIHHVLFHTDAMLLAVRCAATTRISHMRRTPDMLLTRRVRRRTVKGTGRRGRC